MRASTAVFWAIAVTSVMLTLLVVTPAISLDDPFIGLRYARHLVDGYGLVFNAGEPAVEGYSAFLWVIVGALGMALGFEPLGFWQVASVAAQVATLWLTFRLGRHPDRGRLTALVAPLLLGLHVSFVSYPMTGMETTFFTLVVTWGTLIVAVGRHRTRAGALGLGLVLLLICLTRFDGVGLAGLLLAWVLLVERRVKSFVWALAPLLAGLVAYNGWRLAFYGDPLPNTFYAKSHALTAQLAEGVSYLLRFATRGGPVVVLLLAPFLLAGKWRRTTKLCAWVIAGHLAYVVVVGGDWMPYYRFVLPVLPLLCVLVQEGFWATIERLRYRDAALARRWVVPGLVGLALFGLLPLMASTYVRRPPVGPYWHPEEARQIAQAISPRLPEDSLVAVEWAGIMPFYLRQPVLDIFGLSDREITSGQFPGTMMGRGITPEYLAGRHPDLVVYSARVSPSAAEAALVGPAVRGEGLWITRFYDSLLRPEHGYTRCVVRLAEGRYWPVLARRDLEFRQELCVP